MKTARILATLFSLSLVLVSARGAYATVLKGISVKPSNPTPAQASVSHTVSFTTEATSNYKSVQLDYCTTPSGTCNAPATIDVDGGAVANMSAGFNSGTWAKSVAASTNNTFCLSDATGETPADSSEEYQFDITTVTNQAITECDVVTNVTSTCYVKIETNSAVDCGGTAIDVGTTTVTVVAAVSVTATVDPIFTFTVAGVDSDNIANEITTSVSSAFNTLPFSNIVAGEPEYAAHTLTVTTNAQNGYSIYSKMTTAMTGEYTDNNIDPFKGLWSAPSTWTEPDGTTPNTDTGWVGANTTDTDITQWYASASPEQKFGGVVGTGDGVLVSYSTTSDNGSSAVTVTYGLEVNFRQPSDTYTGTIMYTALPSY